MNVPWELVATIIVAIFGSTGFWNWLSQRKASNSDILTAVREVRTDVDVLRTKVEAMERSDKEHNAVSARRHIITFNEGLLRGERHSKEAFDQVLGDIDEYEKYCRSHPDFLNNKTKLSVEHITDCYRKAERDRDFL